MEKLVSRSSVPVAAFTWFVKFLRKMDLGFIRNTFQKVLTTQAIPTAPLPTFWSRRHRNGRRTSFRTSACMPCPARRYRWTRRPRSPGCRCRPLRSVSNLETRHAYVVLAFGSPTDISQLSWFKKKKKAALTSACRTQICYLIRFQSHIIPHVCSTSPTQLSQPHPPP